MVFGVPAPSDLVLLGSDHLSFWKVVGLIVEVGRGRLLTVARHCLLRLSPSHAQAGASRAPLLVSARRLARTRVGAGARIVSSGSAMTHTAPP